MKLMGLLVVMTLLAGCGFKGPLQLPDEGQKQEQVK
jgi:predicted small lipoprotein YifL